MKAKKWKYEYETPAKGKLYQKGNRIMIVYERSIRLYAEIPEGKVRIPCFAKWSVSRKRNAI